MNLLGIPIETNDSLPPGEFAIASKPDRNGVIEIVSAGYRWRVKRVIRDFRIVADGTDVEVSAQVRHEILSYEKLGDTTG